MEKIIRIDNSNIDKEHICCAFSDKKCAESYNMKKEWLRKEFANGYVFRRIDARAKVFIEYGPAEKGWAPVHAPNYLLVNCFWVSGQYKGQGYAKALLNMALDDARMQNKNGLVTVAGTSKFHFMSDTKWLLKHGFETVEKTLAGFSLLALKLKQQAENPSFHPVARSGACPETNGLVVYYSNRCPFSEFHVKTSLVETAAKRGKPLKIIKLETTAQAQHAPSPATIFSLFYNGKFVTTDVSVCLDSRFDKVMNKFF
jgi:GNAT superfamily N-acetyltransferase